MDEAECEQDAYSRGMTLLKMKIAAAGAGVREVYENELIFNYTLIGSAFHLFPLPRHQKRTREKPEAADGAHGSLSYTQHCTNFDFHTSEAEADTTVTV